MSFEDKSNVFRLFPLSSQTDHFLKPKSNSAVQLSFLLIKVSEKHGMKEPYAGVLTLYIWGSDKTNLIKGMCLFLTNTVFCKEVESVPT